MNNEIEKIIELAKEAKIFDSLRSYSSPEIYNLITDKSQFNFLYQFCLSNEQINLIECFLDILKYKTWFVAQNISSFNFVEEKNIDSKNHEKEFQISKFAQKILNNYIQINSPKSIKMNRKSSKEIINKSEFVTFDVFDKALFHLLSLFSESIYPNLIKSKFWKESPEFKQKKEEIIYREVLIQNNLPQDRSVLNFREWKGLAREPVVVSANLLQFILDIIRDSISSKNILDLEFCSSSVNFRRFSLATSELKKVYISDINYDQMKAFFLNIFHLLMLHITLLYEPPVMNKQLFTLYKYEIGGFRFNLEDINFGILRKNAIRSVIGISKEQFRAKDLRKDLIIPYDQRINFVLSFLYQFSPPIKIYFPENIDEQLNLAGFEICKSIKTEMKLKKKKNILKLIISKVFEPIIKDSSFDQKEFIFFLLKYVNYETREIIQKSLTNNDRFEFLFENFDQNTYSLKISSEQQIIPKSYGHFNYMFK
ncbi:electron carrier/ protein disulfide oxidoreductase [Anaeramoeba ignava]|uniref:Electron carrier/ protein disulfide oxidoreductase n=1 Tax=Anaeramoeba ignava TaxID=1746090 RepID=A0A9Q0LLB9_ANAIG|nr:electron carrier/ protein disulfide oxidoreductase [Anaeramoeba ignava]